MGIEFTPNSAPLSGARRAGLKELARLVDLSRRKVWMAPQRESGPLGVWGLRLVVAAAFLCAGFLFLGPMCFERYSTIPFATARSAHAVASQPSPALIQLLKDAQSHGARVQLISAVPLDVPFPIIVVDPGAFNNTEGVLIDGTKWFNFR